MRERTSAAGAVLALTCCLFLAGCGDDKGWPKCYPVSGQVMIDGKPAVRATVTFHPLAPQPDGKSFRASTFTDEKGTFRLTTFTAGDGAPAGDYTVTVVANFIYKDGDDTSVPDLLGGKYSDPKVTPLKANVATSPNTLAAFQLQSSAEE